MPRFLPFGGFCHDPRRTLLVVPDRWSLMAFKHEVREKTTSIERSESWHAEIDGYLMGVDRRESGFTEVFISPLGYDGLRLPLMKFYPKHVNDVALVADKLPALLRVLVAELQVAGLDDLRSESDRRQDKRREEIKADRAKWTKQIDASEEKLSITSMDDGTKP